MRELKVNSIFQVFDDEYKSKPIYIKAPIQKEKSVNVKTFRSYISAIKSPMSLKKPAKQCVVKMISNLNAKGTKNCLFYIAKNAENNKIFDEKGNELNPNEIYKNWGNDFGTNENSKDCWHLVFSVKDESRSKTSLDALQRAVKDTLDLNFLGHKYAMCIHNHQNNPHVHVVINKKNFFTKKKIHFDSKDEIKDFFNDLRDDYAKNLNIYGFNYYNINTYAKDLEKENDRAEKSLNNAYETKYKFQNVYNKMRELNEEKIIIKNTQKENLDKELEQNLLTNKHLIELLNQYTLHQNKKKYKILKELKENNKKRKELCNTGIRIKKELKEIQKELEKINISSNELYNNLGSDYKILKSFCWDFEKKYLKTADKKSMDIYLKAKKEFKELGDKLDSNLKNSVDSAVLYQKLFGKDENSFNIIKGLDMIEKNKLAVATCDLLNDDEKKGYENTFNKNEKFMRELLEKRFEKIKEKVENNASLDKNSFLVKEYAKAKHFLEFGFADELKDNELKNNIQKENIIDTTQKVFYQSKEPNKEPKSNDFNQSL